MGLPTPSDNLKNYKKSGVTSRVERLRGKKFMLVHGTGDDNVHFQQAMALSKALSEADILYDQVSYPDEAHSLNHVTKHLYHTMDKFWSECFGYKPWVSYSYDDDKLCEEDATSSENVC